MPRRPAAAQPCEGVLARGIGLVGAIDEERTFDVVVVGGEPAGLATAVYAGSEGLSLLVLDCRSFGDQAGASARIENYLGFPTGISGMALMAQAYNQAQKFGVELAIPDEVTGLDCGSGLFWLKLATGETVHARSAVIATGARSPAGGGFGAIRGQLTALLGLAAGSCAGGRPGRGTGGRWQFGRRR